MTVVFLPTIDTGANPVGSTQSVAAPLAEYTEVVDAKGRRVHILSPGTRKVFTALSVLGQDWARAETLLAGLNANTSAQSINATTAYVVGASIPIPVSGLKVGAKIRWRFIITKSAAGSTAGCAFLVKLGVAGTGADATILTFTLGTPTGVVDAAEVELEMVVRSIGATGVIAGGLCMSHNLAATGFSTLPTEVVSVTSGAIDMTVAALIAGVSILTTAASVWSVEMVTVSSSNL